MPEAREPIQRPLRVGVIGAGEMGRHHVRVYHELDVVELVAVADLDEAILRRVTRDSPARAYLDHRGMLDREDLDAVSLVVPTSVHARIAHEVIDRGIGLLVEKPIASTSEEGRAIVSHAEAEDVMLAVGHIERFNPAVIELARLLHEGALGRVFQIKARRTGPFPERIRDVGVVIDLATHDLDLMLTLTGARIDRVYAETVCGIGDTRDDMVSALIRFSDGAVGTVDVNWLTPTKVRDLTVVGARGMFVVDYLTQDLYFYENSQPHETWDHLSMLHGVTEGKMTRFVVQREEPLRRELRSFIDAVRRHEPPQVSGRDGIRALLAAEALLASASSGQIVSCPDLDDEHVT